MYAPNNFYLVPENQFSLFPFKWQGARACSSPLAMSPGRERNGQKRLGPKYHVLRGKYTFGTETELWKKLSGPALSPPLNYTAAGPSARWFASLGKEGSSTSGCRDTGKVGTVLGWSTRVCPLGRRFVIANEPLQVSLAPWEIQGEQWDSV